MMPQISPASASIHQKRKITTEDKLWQCLQQLRLPPICYALLSTLLVLSVCANPSEASTMKVSELPFSEKLSNPCSLVDAKQLQRGNQKNGDAEKRKVINELKAKASLLKEKAETILRTNVLKDCSTLGLSTIATIPSSKDISGSKPLNALRLFYTSLLKHTAHVYFIKEQQKRHEAETNCNSKELSESAESLASDMRDLMCAVRLSVLTIQEDGDKDDSFEDSTKQILNEQLTDQPQCSRRSLRDCQTIGSTVKLLSELSTYLRTAVF